MGEEPQTSPALRLSVQMGVVKKGGKRDSDFIDGHDQVTHISVLLFNSSSRLSRWEWSLHGYTLAERAAMCHGPKGSLDSAQKPSLCLLVCTYFSYAVRVKLIQEPDSGAVRLIPVLGKQTQADP